MNEIINELMSREYYWDVAEGFVVEAVEDILSHAEEPMDIDAIDKKVRAEYI